MHFRRVLSDFLEMSSGIRKRNYHRFPVGMYITMIFN